MTNYTYLETLFQDLRCRLYLERGCGDTEYGLDCSPDGFISYNCKLNIDIQNETSYSCKACFNATLDPNSNGTTCNTGFKLNLFSIAFENALKSIWMRLPSTICDSELLCIEDNLNRTLYIDVSNETFKSGLVESFQCNVNYRNVTVDEFGVKGYDWSFLFVILFIIAGGVGNILVCLAVCLDKRLQNVTNYFLLSLAIADLLVSLFVMPMGAIPGFLGKLNSIYLLTAYFKSFNHLCAINYFIRIMYVVSEIDIVKD